MVLMYINFFDDTFGVKIAVQCKGYEGEWHRKRLSKLKKEIRKFINKADPVCQYWLVLNRSIIDPDDRKEIEGFLNMVVDDGKAKTTMLLDLDKFIKEIGSRAVRRFRKLTDKARQNHNSMYRAVVESVEYLPNIPFIDECAQKENLIDYVILLVKEYVKHSDPHHTGPTRNPPRLLITGSFGFGKTISLLALGEQWTKEDQDVFFFPAVNLSDDAFVNSAGLLSDVISQLADDELASSEIALAILHDVCRHEFRTHYPLLIIDAIDESHFWHDSERLGMLWGSISQLGIPVAVTVRDELYSSRPKEFSVDADTNFFRRLALIDWTQELMTQFLDRFAL